MKKYESFTIVCKTAGSGSRENASIWAPNLELGIMHSRSKVRMCFGHYAVSGFTNPARTQSNNRKILEIKDKNSRMSKSNIERAANECFPFPVRFREIISLVWGSIHFKAWKPIPPSDHFVALGVVITTKKDEVPSQFSVRYASPLISSFSLQIKFAIMRGLLRLPSLLKLKNQSMID